MARRFRAADPAFAAEFAAFLNRRRGGGGDADAAAQAILADVRARGFAAVAEATRRFDDLAVTEADVCVEPDAVAAAVAACDPADLEALRFAATRIRSYHRRQAPKDHRFTDEAGVELGWRWTPIRDVGLYVPGGRASYPSSVLMNAIPAQVAGASRIAMVAPTPGGHVNPLVLAAAHIAGVEEIYRIGGAQAVGALAYGAGPIAPVDKIVGPGNAYVAAAKRAVFGDVGIDTIAGPSEILVVADAANDPAWIAADLLSQAEHDPLAQAILVTDDAAFADQVAAAVDSALAQLPTRAVAGASWADFGAIVLVEDLADAPGVVDRVAPEHLELAVADPDALADHVTHAGAIFLGRRVPEVLGDYVTGSNHVLPTAGAARFASGLSVLDFMKRTSLQRVDRAGMARLGPPAARLARAEGLAAHALAVDLRLGEDA